MPRICLFIPTYNVRNRIQDVLKGIPASALEKIELVLIIDNGSDDGTLDAAKAFVQSCPHEATRRKFRVFRNSMNYLLGGSTIVAFKLAIAQGFDYLICMHGDGQADPKCLVKFLEYSKDGIDFVFGSRFLPDSDVADYSALRQAGNWAFVKLQQLLLHEKIYDIGAFISFNLKTIAAYPYYRLPHDMGYHPLLVLYVCRHRKITFREFPMRWGKVESSNVNIVDYAFNHLWRLARFAAGSIPLTDKNLNDFTTTEVKCS